MLKKIPWLGNAEDARNTLSDLLVRTVEPYLQVSYVRADPPPPASSRAP